MSLIYCQCQNTNVMFQFVLGALFAGQLNSGINAGWMFVYLATNRYWYDQVRAEVDGVVEKHRKSPDQSRLDVLSSLTIENWESDFPLIDLCLRECIRFQLVGTAFRKNISGKDVPIGKAGEVVPRDAFAVSFSLHLYLRVHVAHVLQIYLLDDVHFNPEVYTEPNKWDPGRYLPDRAEDKKTPLSYLGWGVGRHPCCKCSPPKLVRRHRLLTASLLSLTAVGMRVSDWTPE